MKKIYLMRHAKAEQENYDRDYERDLNAKGEQEIKDMLKRLSARDFKVEKIISSAALRTTRTARLLAKGLNFDEKNIIFEKALYEASCRGLFEFIKGLDDAFNECLIVGHNPAMRELCELLSKSTLSSFPTTSIFGLEFEEESFANIKAHSGKLLFFEHIKGLK
ncbi:SixA phosphatase family protein [Campylobacter troglodytis]|uniref:SixA phosphatase family protein n=1 Tax=Campylobacter troglodytis TaxID=654363 RepID=UPI00115BA2E4|nr:histidine phosphatase family protein [Campylobacter troglodytis]TQR54092.1 phosphoglycerate mutase [Campylobacter troglodytis]